MEKGYAYDYGPDDVRRALRRLGFPIHPDKGDGVFRAAVDFIGFFWDLEKKEVGLPEKKRRKFLRRVDDFMMMHSGVRTCSRKDVEKIHGSLCHVAFVMHDGRSRLPSLGHLMSDFDARAPFTRIHTTSAVVRDMRWWREVLSEPARPRCIKNCGPP